MLVRYGHLGPGDHGELVNDTRRSVQSDAWASRDRRGLRRDRRHRDRLGHIGTVNSIKFNSGWLHLTGGSGGLLQLADGGSITTGSGIDTINAHDLGSGQWERDQVR